MYGAAGGSFPIYHAEGIYEDNPEIESQGAFNIDISEKVLRCEVNLTSDASQNLQMYGAIPDTRSASVNNQIKLEILSNLDRFI
jgi:hypothetical protein